MMKQYILSLIAIVFACFVANDALAQGSTTASMSGIVKDKNGEALPGATVVALHTPTGSQFGAVTTISGNYTILNMNVGGPYTVTVQYVGYEPQKKENIYLSLGQTLNLSFNLAEAVETLEGVTVTSGAELIDGEQTGAQTTVSEEQLGALPTISRDLSDFTRTTPQARVTPNGGITIAGQNNRYNSIMIDGAVNNDVFGLSETGTNGGQSGISPISLDAIEQVQIVVAPYDVRQGGFAGGGVNAVTRSGSNKVEGSAYYLFRNESLAGKTPTDDESFEREKLADFSSYITGFRLGAPLIKNKLFIFINGETENTQTPQPFNFNDYTGNSSLTEIENLASTLQSRYGYDAGGFLDNTRELKSNKVFARLDWNINDKHKLTVRHSYTQGDNVGRARSNAGTINFGNNGVGFPTVTNSSALELKSRFGDNKSNSLIIGYTNVTDDRDPIGADFPRVTLRDGSGTILFGSEAFSTGNQLKQSTLTITDNFSIFKGKHTLTFGTHNEFYSTYNLFIRRNYGEYVFSNLNDFINESPAIEYRRSYSLIDNKTGDGSAAAAEFTGFQLGLYAQDEYAASEKLNLTFGIRVDMPVFADPNENKEFNTTTLPQIKAAYPELGGKIKSGQLWGTPLLVSPRIGFNYDVMGDKSLQIRGGAGIFTSRIPLVWPGGAYNNNGVTIGEVRIRQRDNIPVDFIADPFKQYTASDLGINISVPSGQMDLFVEDFKLPQVVRASLAVDKQLPWGIVGTLEGIYTKTLNNVTYYNLNINPATTRFTGADDRLYYTNGKVDGTYTDIIVGDNTNKGYSYNVTAQLQKSFEKGFMASIAYTYGRSMVINDGLSSQNSSQWRYMQTVNGRNNLDLTYSNFDLGSRIIGMLSYRLDYLNHAATTISLFYEGRSGQRLSYVYNQNIVNDDFAETDLIYVPANQSEIEFSPLTRNVNGETVTVTPEQQWQAFDTYIKNDEYLNSRRGNYAERNGSRLPFVNTLDLRLLQDFYIKTSNGTKHNLQLSFDIFNFTNLLNKDWGRIYFVSNDNFALVNFNKVNVTDTNPDPDITENIYTPTFTFGSIDSNGNYQSVGKAKDIYTIDDSGINSSRWQMQIGIRYSF